MTPKPEPILLNRRETARLLNISERSLINYEREGYFAPIRIGGQVKHRRQDIDAALEKLASVAKA